MARHRLATTDELRAGELKMVEVAGVRICLARTHDGTFRAVSDTCTHEDASLSEGSIVGSSVECPSHGSLFDLRTGAVTGLPAITPVRTYTVSVDGDHLVIDL
jgi:3-phenylpropionate/trans-cinnamate dioxygenase ferredoxin subunit